MQESKDVQNLTSSVQRCGLEPANDDDGRWLGSWKLERQLHRCSTAAPPGFCTDRSAYANMLGAYDELWNAIEKNKVRLERELWSCICL